MKKFLSLVLALVMTMSLVTISAGAKDFTDDSSITYNEAIDVMSAVKVIDGYPDGSFKPTNQLNRGQAAKILCNMLLGPTTASALKADAAPFKDVAADNTFAGYIAYCAQAGIIDGYTDGTFRPTAPLTGYAFMKLLLGALGYDKDVEGYNVPNWSINVAKQALAIGLDAGLKGDFDGTKIVTREEACLYAFNALQADLVEYGSKTSVNVGGAEVVIAGTAAKAMTWNNSATKKTNIKNDDYVQFAEQYFNKLVKYSTSNDFGEPATKWTYKGDKVGTYTETPAKTYAKNVKLGTIYADLGMNQADNNAKVFYNGDEAYDVKVSKNNAEKIADSVNKKLVGDGTRVHVFYDEDTNDVTICLIDLYVGVVTNVVTKNVADPYIVVQPYSTMYAKASTASGSRSAFVLTAAQKKFETTESFAEDDIVVFTYSQSANAIKEVTKPESVEGEATKLVKEKSISLGETVYEYAQNVAFLEGTGESNLNTKNDYTVYLDENGLAIYVGESEFKATDYAFVLYAQGASTLWGKDRAQIVTHEGRVLTVDTDDDYSAAPNNLSGKVVYYREMTNGKYSLRLAPRNDDNGGAVIAGGAVNGVAGTHTAPAYGPAAAQETGVAGSGATDFVMKNDYAKITTAGKVLQANSETVFVVAETDLAGKTVYSAYTGVKNAPTILSDGTGAAGVTVTNGVAGAKVEAFWASRSNGLVAFMFIDATNANVTSGKKDVVFLAGKESVSKHTTNYDGKTYYTYNAVVDGEITTVDVLSTVPNAGQDFNGVYTKLEYNNNGMVKGMSAVNPGDYDVIMDKDTDVKFTNSGSDVVLAATGVWKLTGKYTVGLGGATAATSTRYTVSDSAKMYYVDASGDITKLADTSEIFSDASSEFIALLDVQTGDIQYLFIQEVDKGKHENAPGAPAGLTAVLRAPVDSTALTVTLTGGVAGKDYNVTLTQINTLTGFSVVVFDGTVRRDSSAAQIVAGTPLANSGYMYQLRVDGKLLDTSIVCP